MCQVRVVSEVPLPVTAGGKQIGISYHLLDEQGVLIQWDHPRSYLDGSLKPGEAQMVDVPIVAPWTPGVYGVELDMVWEGVTWLKHEGAQLTTLKLNVV